MINYLILVSVVCIICIVASRFSGKIGLPSLLIFIVIGMLFGSDGIFKIHFDNFELSEQICSVALIFIIFYGGFGINLKSAKPVIGKALILSTAGVVLTALITGGLCYLVLGTSLVEGLLIGAVLSSTDAASVFSILRGKKLNLKSGIAPMLEMESGSNDPISFMLTTIILGYMTSGGIGSVPQLLFSQIGFGVLGGFTIGLASTWMMNRVHLREQGLKSLLVVAVALLAYALPTVVNGNGFLSVYIVGMILGNYKFKYKVDLVHFFDGITQMMQMLLFFILGLLAFPSQIPNILVPALAVAIFITFIARPIAVAVLLTPFKVPWNEQLFISWCGLRGAASIVFAILTVVSPAYTHKDIFHIVFLVSLLSVAFQGTFLPQMARLLKVEDKSNDTMKTFNDYQDEEHMSLIKAEIGANHPWAYNNLQDITLPEGMLVALIRRKEESIFPKGDTIILPEDLLVICSPSYVDDSGMELQELVVAKGNKMIGRNLNQIDLNNQLLVIMIKRNKKVIIPQGDTKIKENDKLIMMFNGNKEIKKRKLRDA